MTLHLWNECICLMNAAVKCCLLVYGQPQQRQDLRLDSVAHCFFFSSCVRWIPWIKPISWRCIRFFPKIKIQTSKSLHTKILGYLWTISIDTAIIIPHAYLWTASRTNVRRFKCKWICLIAFNSQINKALFQVYVSNAFHTNRLDWSVVRIAPRHLLSLKYIAKRMKIYMPR